MRPRHSAAAIAMISIIAAFLTQAVRSDPGATAQAPNMLRNAGFRDAGSGVTPDYWACPEGPVERADWPQCWGLDDACAIPGTRSMRLSNATGQQLNMRSFYLHLPKAATLTLSVYLKADHEDTKVSMRIGDLKSKPITVGTRWQRHTLTATIPETEKEKPDIFTPVMFVLVSNATLWVNAPLLEQGDKATDFRLSPADPSSGELATHVPPPYLVLPLPTLECPVTTTPPKIDGSLDDDCWKRASVARDFLIINSAVPAKEKTEAYIARDADNLYVAFRCHESDMGKLKSELTARDSKVFTEDAAEFFFSPWKEGFDHMHIAVNPIGTVWDARGSDESWNIPGLEVKTGRESGAWTVEMRIPFADLQLPISASPVWRVNFGRERAAPKMVEVSTWAPVLRGFHNSPRFGFLRGFDLKELARHLTTSDESLVAYPDRSFYTTESIASIVVRLSFPDKVKVKFNGREQIVEISDQGLVPLEIGKLDSGEHHAEVSASGISRQVMIRKLPPQANDVKMDRQHRMLLVDGKLFMPFATMAKSPAEVEDQANAGFNTIITSLHYKTEIEPYQAVLDKAQARGLKVIVWYSIKRNESMKEWTEPLMKLVERYKNHPALLAWYVMDEPPASLTWSKDVLEMVKAADPHHPAFINWCGTWTRSMSERGGDILCLDDYPIGRMSNDEAMIAIADHVTAMNRDAIDGGKPLAFWHVFYGSYDSPREPTPLEEQCLTYTSIVHGCRALFYFCYKPMSVPLWNSMAPLAKEMQALLPAFAGDDVSNQVFTDNPAIHFQALSANGIIYLITVNTTDRPQSCRLTFKPKIGERAEVMFENRGVSCSGGLRDSFGQLERHVYKIAVNPQAAAGPDPSR